MNKKNLDNITIIDDIFEDQYMNILNDEYDGLEANIYKSKALASVNPPQDYMKNLNTSIYNPSKPSEPKRSISAQQVVNDDIDTMNRQNKFFFDKQNNIQAADVPLVKNINGQDSIKMYEPNTKFAQAFKQPSQIANNIPSKQPRYMPPQMSPHMPPHMEDRQQRRLRDQSCLDYIYHVEKCPACKRYFSYEKNMYLVVTIMITILAFIIIAFLMNELSKKK
jgi:hypothetical protein